jgi:hypothetical protein
MAKKKQAEQVSTAQTADGYEVVQIENVIIDEVEYITGIVGECKFYWFTDGKRNNGFEDPKDLI